MIIIDLKLNLNKIKKMKMNKRGAEKIISVYWFVILFMVAGTIAYSVSIFYGDPYDVRGIESNILINKIADCLSKNGKLDSEINQNNFFEICNLNFGNDKDEYYVEIKIDNFRDGKPSEPFIVEGNINLKDNLNIGSIFKSEKSFYVLNEIENKDSESNNQEETSEEKKQIQITAKELIVKIFIVINKAKENVG